jgi:hypothetical protein
MSANINVATMKADDLTMNLGVPNLNLPQVTFFIGDAVPGVHGGKVETGES